MQKRDLVSVIGAAWIVMMFMSIAHINRISALPVDNKVDPSFDLFNELAGTKYENNPEYFENAFNKKYYEALKVKFNQEKKDRYILERGGISSKMFRLAASFLSPMKIITCFLILLITYRVWAILIAAFCSAMVSEVLLTTKSTLHAFGDSLLYGFGAGLIWAFLIYFMISYFSAGKRKAEASNA